MKLGWYRLSWQEYRGHGWWKMQRLIWLWPWSKTITVGKHMQVPDKGMYVDAMRLETLDRRKGVALLRPKS